MVDSQRLIRLAEPVIFRKLYERKLIDLFGASSVIALWPVTERFNSTAYDFSANGFNGTYSGVILADTVGPRLKPAPKWDGVNDYINVYSAGLAAAFNPNEGSLLIWYKILNSGVWSDGTNDFMINFTADGSNYVRIIKLSTTNNINWGANFAGVNKSISLNTNGNLNWLLTGLTYSKSADQMKAFYNGAQAGSTQTGLGTFTGSLSASFCAIGSQSSAGATPCNGWLAYALLLNRAATPAEFARAYAMR
jgi:hypothetical protein